uniref:Uncharacterized protein n=1 Tax=Glossina austeni TaxID=7395 RepID=A0A1A9UWD2_GLOAU
MLKAIRKKEKRNDNKEDFATPSFLRRTATRFSRGCLLIIIFATTTANIAAIDDYCLQNHFCCFTCDAFITAGLRALDWISWRMLVSWLRGSGEQFRFVILIYILSKILNSYKKECTESPILKH